MSISPSDGATVGRSFRTIEIAFSEAIDEGTVDAQNFALLGPSGEVQPVDIRFSTDGQSTQLVYPQLAVGAYQLTVHTPLVTDRAGNPLGAADTTSNFTVAQGSIFWTNPAGGFWDEPSNWSGGVVPGTDDDVVIAVAGGAEVVFRQGTSSIHSLYATNPFAITGGVLHVDQTVQADNNFSMSGGTLEQATVLSGSGAQGLRVAGAATLDGVRMDADVDASVDGAVLVLSGGMVLNGVLQVGDTIGSTQATVQLVNSQTIGGSGTIALGPGTGNRIVVDAGAVASFGPTLRVQGTGSLNGPGSIVNQGTLTALGGSLQITADFTNSGALEAPSGGVLAIASGTLGPNSGTIAVGASGQLTVNGPLTQSATGSIRVDVEGISQFGQVSISGLATLDGALVVNLVGGFQPGANDGFRVLGYGSRSGTFATITSPNLDSRLIMVPTYEAAELALEARDIFETITPALRLDASQPQNLVREGAVELTTGKYLTAADVPLLEPTDELTILLRVNQTTLGLDRNFVTKWTYGGQGSYALSTGLHANQQRELTFWTANPNGTIGVWAVTNGANLQANTSYEVALVYDGKLAPADRVRFVIDGRVVPVTIENGMLPATLAPSNAPLNVGKWGGGFDRYMDGAIESLAIYNKALADADVAALQAAAPQYAQLAPEAKVGLAAWWDMEEASGDRIDSHNGIALMDPTGASRRELVSSFADPAHGVDLTQGYAKRPQYVENSPMNNQGAILFDGVNDALVQQISDVLTSEVGDAYLVVRFPSDAVLQYDTFFSIASYESENKYMFFSLETINPALDPTSDGLPHFRLRWRDGDVWNTDIRGAGVVERDKTYLLHFWGNGPGLGWGMEVNGVDQRPFAKTGNAYFVDGSWFGDLTDEDNMTVGDFERSDGAQGFARYYLGEILAFASKLSSAEEDLVEQYLATKWAVTLGE